MSGWVKVHRQLDQHWLSASPERLGAWVTLLLMANHQDKKVLIGAQLVEVKRGSFITSQRKLQRKWGWSREKFNTFFTLLQADGMCTYNSTNKYTYITITNYDTYQTNPTTDQHTDQPPISAQTDTQSVHKPTTNKNDKNEKKGKNEKKISPNGDEITFPSVLDSPECRTEWSRWLGHKANRREGYKSEDSQEAQLRRCAKLFVTPERFLAAIEFSIAQNYSGIFEETKNKGGKQQQLGTGVFDENGLEYSESFLHNVGYYQDKKHD